MTVRGASVTGKAFAAFRDSSKGRSPTRLAVTGVVAVSLLTLAAACSSTPKPDKQYGVTASPRVVPFGKPVPSGGGYYKVGRPYKVAGRWYKPQEDLKYDEVGLASWYGTDFHGRRTANGEVFDMAGLTAAHPTLPLPTYARVTNLENGRSVVVRVNDRGPFAKDRLIDVSKRTADILEFRHDGTAKVRVQYVGMAPLDGNDGQWLTTTVRENGEAVGPVMLAGLDVPANPAYEAGQATRTAMEPPPPPPAGTPAPYPQPTTVAFTPTTYTGSTTPQEPVSASFSQPADAPVPKVPIGGAPQGTGKIVYRWVQGYAAFAGNDAVSRAFSMFDTDRDTVLVIVQRPTADGDGRILR